MLCVDLLFFIIVLVITPFVSARLPYALSLKVYLVPLFKFFILYVPVEGLFIVVTLA